MKYLEFDSLYKFIISIGIIFILSPFVIFYLLFNKNIDLLISKSEFDKLTQTSQEIVDIKQNLFLNIINSNKYYILAFIIIGVGLLLIGFGIYGWKKAQGQVDLKYILENEKLKKEIGISTEEKRIQVEEEINNDKKILGNDKHSTVYEYMQIEKRLFIVINKEFRDTHEVIQNAKIGEYESEISVKRPLDSKNSSSSSNTKSMIFSERSNPSSLALFEMNDDISLISICIGSSFISLYLYIEFLDTNFYSSYLYYALNNFHSF